MFLAVCHHQGNPDDGKQHHAVASLVQLKGLSAFVYLSDADTQQPTGINNSTKKLCMVTTHITYTITFPDLSLIKINFFRQNNYKKSDDVLFIASPYSHAFNQFTKTDKFSSNWHSLL